MRIPHSYFSPVTIEKIEMIREWRNSERIREKMIDDTIIDSEKQLQWFYSLDKNTDKKYFVFYQDLRPIGMLYFSDLYNQDSCYWGGYIGEEAVWPGSGLILEFAALEYAFALMGKKKLIADVFDDNPSPQKMHILFEYEISGQKKITTKQGLEKNIITFFYTNQNWFVNKAKIMKKLPSQIQASFELIEFLK